MTGGLSMVWHYAQAKRNARRWSNRPDLEAWQDRQVEKHLRKVLPRSAYYRRLYSGLSISDWRQFPIISKTEMMEHFSDLNTVGLRREPALKVAMEAEESRDFLPMIDDVTVGLSSGTSGNRGLFLVRPAERYAWAGSILAKILPGSLLERHRAALFLRSNSNLYHSVVTRRFSFAFFDLLEPLTTLISRLQEFRPTLLVAPPSVLCRLADAQREGRLNLHPKKIFAAAEVLEPQDKLFIEQHLQTAVGQIYQATEGFLGVSCAHGTLHLNEDVLVVQQEWLDEERKKFVPIITDFRRLTQPILRYRLNDILVQRTAPCPCGSPFIALDNIEGRCDDIFVFPAQRGDTEIEVFPDFIRRAVITGSDATREYRVIQHAGENIEVQLEIASSETKRAEISIVKNFEELCKRVGCVVPQICFKPFVHSTPETKLRRVVRRK